MAQFIKEELKEKIITAAKTEFLACGYEKASLRHIAAMAEMTVGNLYHYFDSKEALFDCITADSLNGLKKVARGNSVDFLFSSTHSLRLSINDLPALFDKISNDLITIYEDDRDEFNILFGNERIAQEIKEWISRFYRSFIDNNYEAGAFREEIAILIDCYASAMYAGLRDLFLKTDVSSRLLKSLLRIYLRSYVDMLAIEMHRYVTYSHHLTNCC